jgi:hypothetical protein
MRTNQELQEMYKDLDILADITKKRLEWIEHVVRMDHGREAEKVFESETGGRRRLERQSLRRMEDIDKDLREKKVKSWRQNVVSTEEWASAIKKAKVLRSP